MKPGPMNLITDVPGLKVGNSQDIRLKSGTTVLTADQPFTAGVHVMGGAPGTRETDLLAPDKSVAQIDALVLSGGSAFGLDACSGVVAGLHAAGRGYAVGPARVPIVPGAILFDLLNGGDKDWQNNPYAALGRAAYDAADRNFSLGTAGAGTGALAARVKGGLGSASFVLADGTTVGALVAANPLGSVTTPGDRHFWAAPFEIDGEFGGIGVDPSTGFTTPSASLKIASMQALAKGADLPVEGSNTTIAIVATDAPFSKSQCQRLATAAHDGIGRAIVPAHSPGDGDLVFAVSTGDASATITDAELGGNLGEIGHAAALCLSRAIARAAALAHPEPGDLLPCWNGS
ncbi:P1 family peptidase [Phaeobacter sp. C3_T13_0]|uniref:P1 family peptidase n=1 Tax=Phaeobacter cretensis TaxID=3342641 RepID=UPI0039BC6C43